MSTTTVTIACPNCNTQRMLTYEDGWGRDVVMPCNWCGGKGYMPREEALQAAQRHLDTQEAGSERYGHWEKWAYAQGLTPKLEQRLKNAKAALRSNEQDLARAQWTVALYQQRVADAKAELLALQG